MDTVITRDSDIIREYVAVLDARSRGLSPFARFACVTKLARLSDELDKASLETSDEDIAALHKEIDNRISGGFFRRTLAGRWGARVIACLTLLVGGQLALLAVLAVTAAFAGFVPTPGWWNRVLPHDDPAFVALFSFTFFFAVPMLSILLVSGGRFFHSWRKTIPATILLLAASAVGTYLVMGHKPNPIQRQSSLKQFARERGLTAEAYQQWLDGQWLLKDPKFRADYERYLRNGPGRWVTARVGSGDSSWQGSLKVMNEYIDGGEDPNGLKDWLKFYLDRNRIYSEERIDQEVRALTGDQRYFGVWEVEPFLKERDLKTYRAYLTSINRSMKLWGLLEMAVLILIFIAGYLASPLFGKITERKGTLGLRSDGPSGNPVRDTSSYDPFPERGEITTPPFFETPFRVLGKVHRDFLRLAIFSSVFVFVLLGVIYASGISSSEPGPSSLISLERRYIVFAGGDEPSQSEESIAAPGTTADLRAAGVPSGLAVASSGSREERALAARMAEMEQRIDDNDYDTSKKLKTQEKTLAGQTAELEALKGQTAQLQQTTTPLPQQVEDLSARTGSVEQRAAQALGDASAAKQQTDTVDKRLSGKLDVVDAKATRASQDASRVGEQTSTLATRADALEKELDRRARQIEAQTLELGNRTNTLKEGQDELGLEQQAALDAIISELRADTEELDRQTQSVLYRLLKKGEARRRVELLKDRIVRLQHGLRAIQSKNAAAYIDETGKLIVKVDEIGQRVK